MGSKWFSFNYDVKDWRILKCEILPPELGGFDAVCVSFGNAHDDWIEWDVWGFVRKDIYERLLSGEYSISLSRKTLFGFIVRDADGNPILPHIDKLYGDGVY